MLRKSRWNVKDTFSYDGLYMDVAFDPKHGTWIWEKPIFEQQPKCSWQNGVEFDTKVWKRRAERPEMSPHFLLKFFFSRGSVFLLIPTGRFAYSNNALYHVPLIEKSYYFSTCQKAQNRFFDVQYFQFMHHATFTHTHCIWSYILLPHHPEEIEIGRFPIFQYVDINFIFFQCPKGWSQISVRFLCIISKVDTKFIF